MHRFPEYLSQWSVRIYSCIYREDFPSIWASGVSEYIHPYSSRISSVSEPAQFQSIFLHIQGRFPEYLSQHTFKAYSCIQQQDFPSIWASEGSECINQCSSRISRVSEPMKSEHAFLHIQGGFPEYLSQWSVRICSYIQEQDFPSIWARTLSKHIPAYSSRISRISEPVYVQSIFLHTTKETFPEYLSQWNVRIHLFINRQDFPSIWASEVLEYIN